MGTAIDNTFRTSGASLTASQRLSYLLANGVLFSELFVNGHQHACDCAEVAVVSMLLDQVLANGLELGVRLCL